MAILLRVFPLLAAVVCGVNFVILSQRLRANSSGPPGADVDPSAAPADAARAQQLLRLYFGGLALTFLVLGLCQWLGGFADPFFVFYAVPGNPYALATWGAMFVWDGLIIWYLFRPGYAEAASGVLPGGRGGPAMVRLLAVGGLIMHAAIVAAAATGRLAFLFAELVGTA